MHASARHLHLLERPNNLPIQLSSFVGREQAISELRTLLVHARLLTLSGPGGIGKTRLALAVADAVLPDYADGAWFVELAAVSAPARVAPSVAGHFGLRRFRGDVTQQLAEALRPRMMLLVLDNCEHLLQACADLVQTLLHTCPDLQILATSREPLEVTGEVVWRVPGLTTSAPRSDLLGTSQPAEAIRLFEARAWAVRPDFALTEHNTGVVGDICRQLDGIPLAIELAAARTTVLSPELLTSRLSDRFALLVKGNRAAPHRHQTLRATLDWSYDLLSDAERTLFNRLSVFRGGCSLEAAEAVCAGDEIRPAELMDVLDRLVDKSLILCEVAPGGSVRYRCLETLRQFGEERLTARGEARAMRDRHAQYCVRLAERAERMFVSPQQGETLTLLEVEFQNLRAASTWLAESGDLDTARQMIGSVWFFWEHRRAPNEGHFWLEKLLLGPGADVPRLRIKLLHGLGMIGSWTHDFETATRFSRESLLLARQLGDATSLSCSLHLLGSIALARSKYSEARAFFEEGARAGREGALAPAHTEGVYPSAYGVYFEIRNLITLGRVVAFLGDVAAARGHYEQARDRAVQARFTLMVALAFRGLGLGSYREGDLAAARSALETSRELYSALGEPHERMFSTMTMGRIATDQGDFKGAYALLSESVSEAVAAGSLGYLAESLEGFAGLAAALGQPRRAVRLAGAAAAVRDRLPAIRFQTPSILPRGRMNWIEVARETVGEVTAQAETAAGRALVPAAAVAEAVALQQTESTGPFNPLTRRELEVATLIARGRSNREIADELVTAVSTAERHVANILGKLGLSSRTQVAAWVHEHAALTTAVS